MAGVPSQVRIPLRIKEIIGDMLSFNYGGHLYQLFSLSNVAGDTSGPTDGAGPKGSPVC